MTEEEVINAYIFECLAFGSSMIEIELTDSNDLIVKHIDHTQYIKEGETN